MLTLRTSSRFRRDAKLARKRGMDMSVLESVIQALLEELPLDESYRDHALTGDFIGCRECHLTPDWLLLYRVEHDIMMLVAMRTGAHADLFG